MINKLLELNKSQQIQSDSVQDGEGQSTGESLGKHGQGTRKPSLTSPADTNNKNKLNGGKK